MPGYSALAEQYAQIMAGNKAQAANAAAALRALKQQQDEDDAMMQQNGGQQMAPMMAPGQGMQQMQLHEPGQLSYGRQMGPRRFR